MYCILRPWYLPIWMYTVRCTVLLISVDIHLCGCTQWWMYCIACPYLDVHNDGCTVLLVPIWMYTLLDALYCLSLSGCTKWWMYCVACPYLDVHTVGCTVLLISIDIHLCVVVHGCPPFSLPGFPTGLGYQCYASPPFVYIKQMVASGGHHWLST